MKKRIILCVASILLFAGASAFASSIDLGSLTSSPYSYNLPAPNGDVTTISFDYSYGDFTLPVGEAAFRIESFNGGSPGWMMSINIGANGFNVDTDYGPYYSAGSGFDTTGATWNLAGINHFEFDLDRTNGLWDLAVNGVNVDFYGKMVPNYQTNPIQPDGYTVLADTIIANKFFSDESSIAAQNAVDLGYTTYTTHPVSGINYGVGGTGFYQLQFTGLPGADGAFVDNIQPTPEPATMLLFGLGLLGFARVSRKKRQK